MYSDQRTSSLPYPSSRTALQSYNHVLGDVNPVPVTSLNNYESTKLSEYLDQVVGDFGSERAHTYSQLIQNVNESVRNTEMQLYEAMVDRQLKK